MLYESSVDGATKGINIFEEGTTPTGGAPTLDFGIQVQEPLFDLVGGYLPSFVEYVFLTL